MIIDSLPVYRHIAIPEVTRIYNLMRDVVFFIFKAFNHFNKVCAEIHTLQ